jgi:hypothetical protein
MLAQSAAIERYAARIGKLLPEGDWEMAKNDEIVAFNQVSETTVRTACFEMTWGQGMAKEGQGADIMPTCRLSRQSGR